MKTSDSSRRSFGSRYSSAYVYIVYRHNNIYTTPGIFTVSQYLLFLSRSVIIYKCREHQRLIKLHSSCVFTDLSAHLH